MLALLCVVLSLAIVSPPVEASTGVQGQMVLDLGQQLWESALVGRPSVVYTGSSFMMWYYGRNPYATDSIGLATSTDGVSWSRNALNPVVRRSYYSTYYASYLSYYNWDSDSARAPWVIYEAGQYKMWYEGWARMLYDDTRPNGRVVNRVFRTSSIGYATSPDGIYWTKYYGNPVLAPGENGGAWDSGNIYDPVVVSTGSSYMMYYEGISYYGTVTRMGVATSNDGVYWTKRESPISIPHGSSGWDSYVQSLGSVAWVGNVYVMWYYGASGQNQPFQIGYATSTDGIDWKPYAGNPVITYGSSGNWDDGGVLLPMMLTVGDKYYIYYTAHRKLGGDRIGLAILPTSQLSISEVTPTGLVVVTAELGRVMFPRLHSRDPRLKAQQLTDYIRLS